MTCPRCGSRCWWKRPTSCQACGYVPERAHTDPGYARALREGRAYELAREEARGRVTADDRAIEALMEGIAQMKLYLSAQWSRRREMHDTAIVLRSDGHEIVSRWHEELMGDDNATHEENWRTWALADLEDINGADLFVAFTEEPGTLSRGGRHAEWGYAFRALFGRVFVVGPCESQFYALARERFDDVDALRAGLPSRVCRCLCHVPNPYGYGKHVIACCDEARE